MYSQMPPFRSLPSRWRDGQRVICRSMASYERVGAPHPLQAAPFLPCQTRLVPHRSHISNLLIVAPQLLHEYLRLPPLAVFLMGSPHSGHDFWSCFMAHSVTAG